METQATTILLSPFAPLIQLWAGICLLFFYCELLNKSPFEKARDQVCKLYKETYDELTTRYQVFVPTDDDATFDVTVGEDTHWDKFRTSIYTMAVFCFFYALLVLAVIGIENHKVYSDFHKALQVTNSIALIYYALNVFCDKGCCKDSVLIKEH